MQKLSIARKANIFRFRDDGVIPNHLTWPLIFYRGAIRLPKQFDPAAVIEELFSKNGWRDSWRNGIYDYVHYHSQIHEALGIARGSGLVQFGGKRGKIIKVKAGDVAILPAGTGHERLEQSADFLVVGAYPPAGRYDECTSSEKHPAASKTIPHVPKPKRDPVYGNDGPLLKEWARS